MGKELSKEELAELKKNAKGILSVLRQNIIMKYPFIGAVSMKLELVPVRDFRCRTACTDGHSIFFDIAFLSELDDEERKFVFAHEVWHNVLLHFTRKQTRIAELFNLATDMEVNQLLDKDGFTHPENLVWPDEFNFKHGLSAEEYYELLLKTAKKNSKKNANSSSQNSSGNGSGNSSNNKNNSGNSSNSKKLSGQFDKHTYEGDDEVEVDENGNVNTGIVDKYGEVGIDSDFKVSISKDAAEKMREAAISAAQQAERTRGVLPAHIQEIINKLKKPEIRWQEVLAQFVTRCFGEKRQWCPPNRRHVWHDTYLQSRRGEKIKIAVGIDTSGSTQGDIPKFLGELNALVNSFGNYEIHLIQCDAEVQDYKMYDQNDPLILEGVDFGITGCGGTTLHPIFDYVKDNQLDIDAYVVFTDGYIEEFPKADDPGKPVLWIITKDGSSENIHFGEIVKFKEPSF